MAITYDIEGVHYPSQASLEREVKAYLRGMPRDRAIASSFLKEIVNTLHPDVLRSVHKSDGEFRLLTWREQQRLGMQTAEQFRGGELMQTFFTPLDRWQDVTVYPWKRPPPRAQVVAALRAKASAYIPKPIPADQCSAAGCTAWWYDLEYHHISPTFAQIVEQAMTYVTEEEIAFLFGYDKFADGCYTLADFIDDDHPAVQLIRRYHQFNESAWLCKAHHAEVTHGNAA